MMSKKYSGIVFDFNGTIFWDTKLHNQAWDVFLPNHNLNLTDEEKTKCLHGKTNKEIFTILFNNSLSEEELHEYILEKEKIYQTLCSQSGLNFAPGAIDFIDFLKRNKVEYAIATSSGKENIDFYLSYLHLEKWFTLNQIVYNNGRMKSKPDPEIFETAIKRLGKNPDEVVIFEDSYAGIEAAKKANAGKIIIVNSNGDDYSKYGYDIISNFEQVDKSIFINK
jgi:beta-phosphoglucomutase